MERAVCSVSVAAIRAGETHRSEMVSQLLYGEIVSILDSRTDFSKIKADSDGYEGWVDSKQITRVSTEKLSERKVSIVTQPYVSAELPEGQILLSIGSEVESEVANENFSKCAIASTALLFLNVPYLWSGRSFFGVDCSGFVQLVYKLHGVQLPRDAYQQAEVGHVLDFIEESKPGDLAFFDNGEGNIVHVGIMLETQKIIHAYGKVRIDQLDSSGIYNHELRKHTHRLRFVRRL